jgi:hypothetical protein
LVVLFLLMLHGPVVAADATPAASPVPAGPATKNAAGAATPKRSSDPLVAAVQQVSELRAEAAAAAAGAVELTAHGDTTKARRQMLLAASQLYNASDKLKRIGQKERDLATRGRSLGEQRERIAQAAGSQEDKDRVGKQAKDQLAYAAAQTGMAESMLGFADELHLLGKEAEAASSAAEDNALSDASKKIEACSKKAQELVEEVRNTRAKLETMPR